MAFFHLCTNWERSEVRVEWYIQEYITNHKRGSRATARTKGTPKKEYTNSGLEWWQSRVDFCKEIYQ